MITENFGKINIEDIDLESISIEDIDFDALLEGMEDTPQWKKKSAEKAEQKIIRNKRGLSIRRFLLNIQEAGDGIVWLKQQSEFRRDGTPRTGKYTQNVCINCLPEEKNEVVAMLTISNKRAHARAQSAIRHALDVDKEEVPGNFFLEAWPKEGVPSLLKGTLREGCLNEVQVRRSAKNKKIADRLANFFTPA